MQRWFLSYSSGDQALAARLKETIEREDPALRVFFAPTHMRAGGSWSAQLAQEIADATAFILLIGERLGPWQVVEYDEALDKWAKAPSQFPLIVILLEGQTAPGLPFLHRLHWVITPDPTSEKDIARLFDAASGGGSKPSEFWRYTSPYRGLEAMEEKDSDYFFGRKRETVEVLLALASAPDRFPVLIGNSGVGKSSLVQAGVLASLKRQAWPKEADAPNDWPAAFQNSRQWCFLSLKPGTDSLKALVNSFLDTWQFETQAERVKEQNGFIDLLRAGKATLSDLIDATERRREELNQSKPPGFFLYIDQGEELYVQAAQRQGRSFSELLAQAMPDPRLRTMMSMRSDFLGHLQSDTPLFKARHQIDVSPLREAALREIVGQPAQLLGARFETEGLIDIITWRTLEDSIKDVGALPLLSYTLDDMWKQMVDKGDGVLRLSAPSFELGGVLAARADKFLATHPGSQNALRRVLTLRLATVREDSDDPSRRRAAREEFSDEEWRLVIELANYPNRLLATVTTETRETYAEVAHEAIFRRWGKLREWIAAERRFLAWRSGLEAARRAWQRAPDAAKSDALLMGHALTEGRSWLAKRADDLPGPDREFIALSERKMRSRVRRAYTSYVVLIAIIAGLVCWNNYASIKEQWTWFTTVRPFAAANIRPYILSQAVETDLQPGATFRECATEQGKDYCPEMVVVPAGSFIMGSSPSEKGRYTKEGPQHRVTIAEPFAVSKFELTFDQWDTCSALGVCPIVYDLSWGRGRRPVIYVDWNGAQIYVSWLSKTTGKHYRLLTEAEYEYAARAGTQTAYPWGEDIGKNNADCNGCGSQWDSKQTAPVGSFAPNQFGLYDMVGNVSEWVEDCLHNNYDNAPEDGKAWLNNNNGFCPYRMIRGGSWNNYPEGVRSAIRDAYPVEKAPDSLGFRVARVVMNDAAVKVRMMRRFPQPVRVSDLVGLPVLDDNESTLGYVRQVVRTSQGKTKLIVSYSRWFGWFGRPVAVPVEVVAIFGRQLASLDMPPSEYAAAPTWQGDDATVLPDNASIRVALARR
jgi:formylglycine-generating enzyme required for sulfatase activity